MKRPSFGPDFGREWRVGTEEDFGEAGTTTATGGGLSDTIWTGFWIAGRTGSGSFGGSGAGSAGWGTVGCTTGAVRGSTIVTVGFVTLSSLLVVCLLGPPSLLNSESGVNASLDLFSPTTCDPSVRKMSFAMRVLSACAGTALGDNCFGFCFFGFGFFG